MLLPRRIGKTLKGNTCQAFILRGSEDTIDFKGTLNNKTVSQSSHFLDLKNISETFC